jgi:hypothetical protein
LIRTKELQRAIDEDDGYEYNSLAEHMKKRRRDTTTRQGRAT